MYRNHSQSVKPTLMFTNRCVPLEEFGVCGPALGLPPPDIDQIKLAVLICLGARQHAVFLAESVILLVDLLSKSGVRSSAQLGAVYGNIEQQVQRHKPKHTSRDPRHVGTGIIKLSEQILAAIHRRPPTENVKFFK
jgi:hypothetical protein